MGGKESSGEGSEGAGNTKRKLESRLPPPPIAGIKLRKKSSSSLLESSPSPRGESKDGFTAEAGGGNGAAVAINAARGEARNGLEKRGALEAEGRMYHSKGEGGVKKHGGSIKASKKKKKKHHHKNSGKSKRPRSSSDGGGSGGGAGGCEESNTGRIMSAGSSDSAAGGLDGVGVIAEVLSSTGSVEVGSSDVGGAGAGPGLGLVAYSSGEEDGDSG